jgi:Flp pilus assembly protein TadG
MVYARKLKMGRRRAVAAVEMAIIAPVLVFLTIGMLEMARGMMVKEVLTDAARKGCRTAIQSNGTTAAVMADVTAILTSNNITTTRAVVKVYVNDVEADAKTATIGAKLSVKVSIPVADVAWITPLIMPGAVIESETVIMLSQKSSFLQQ